MSVAEKFSFLSTRTGITSFVIMFAEAAAVLAKQTKNFPISHQKYL